MEDSLRKYWKSDQDLKQEVENADAMGGLY